MRGFVPLFVFVGVIIIGGCSPQRDVDRVARDGAAFLRQAFVEHRYEAAATVGPLDADGLRAIVADVERDAGRLADAQPMSSAPAFDSGSWLVWYRLRGERGAGNVGLLIRANARGGFRVERMHADSRPAPARWPGNAFARR